MRARPTLFSIALTLGLAACQAAPPAGPAGVGAGLAGGLSAAVVGGPVVRGTGRIVVAPSFVSGAARALRAVVTPYEQADIVHMEVKAFTWDGTTEAFEGMIDLPTADLGRPVVFGNLANDTTYRIRAYAYKAAGTAAADKISLDASSFVTLAVGADDTPVLGSLTVRLADVPFVGAATSEGLDVTEGGYTYAPGIDVVVTPPEGVSTFAGSGVAGFADGAPADAAFFSPHGLDLDAAGNLYVADRDNHRIRKVTPAGVVSTFAGSGAAGAEDGMATFASFFYPTDVAVGSDGAVYVADQGNHLIRKVAPGGVVVTVAGTGAPGLADGAGTAAAFKWPQGLALDPAGNLYVADSGNHALRKIAPDGTVTTLAGTGASGAADGPGAAATFSNPVGITAAADGTLYVADYFNHKIRVVSPAGAVSTLAGIGFGDYAEGVGAAARFQEPVDVLLDGAGGLIVADRSNHRLRRLALDGTTTPLAGDGTLGHADGDLGAARFAHPWGLARDGAGRIYVGDTGNYRVRRVVPATP